MTHPGPYRTAIIACLIAALVGAVAITAVAASAPLASAQPVRSSDPVEFGGVNEVSRAVRIVGDQLWVGGEFTEATSPERSVPQQRSALAIFDMNTGELLPLAPNPNGEVRDIESDDATTVWVAGDFTEIAGRSIAYLAAFDAVTGEMVDSFDLGLDDAVYDLHFADGWLYVGGIFRNTNDGSFDRLLRVDPSTGQIDATFQPDPNAIVRSIDNYGDRIYVAGFFDRIGRGANRVDRLWVAGLDVATGEPVGPEFALAPLAADEALKKQGVRRIEIAHDGSAIYTGDRRNTLTAWNRLDGELMWARETEGDIQAIQAGESSVYVGTHDGLLAKGDQRLLFAITPTGEIDPSFTPLMNSFYGTEALDAGQGALVAVGAFTRVNGEPVTRIAVFHGPDWQGATPLGPRVLIGDVNCDGEVDVGDAVAVAQFSVGARTATASCVDLDTASQIGPGGDVNADGVIDLADAIAIAQCAVGVTQPFCPDA